MASLKDVQGHTLLKLLFLLDLFCKVFLRTFDQFFRLARVLEKKAFSGGVHMFTKFVFHIQFYKIQCHAFSAGSPSLGIRTGYSLFVSATPIFNNFIFCKIQRKDFSGWSPGLGIRTDYSFLP